MTKSFSCNLSLCCRKIEKIIVFIVITSLCDEQTLKFDISQSLPSLIFSVFFSLRNYSTRVGNFVLSAQDRENHRKKINEKKVFLAKKLEVRCFQIPADLFTADAHCNKKMKLFT